MNKRARLASFLGALALTVSSVAAAATFNLFQPANGILKGNPSTYVTTAAASSDVIALWSGTCDATTFLKGDGSCGAALSGTVPVSNGGTGAISLSGVLRGNGTSAVSSAASSDVISLWSGTCDATTFLKGDGSCGAASGGTPGGLSGSIQYNNGSGGFAGHATFTYNGTTRTLSLGSTGGANGEIRGMERSGVGNGAGITLASATANTAGNGGILNILTGDGGTTSGNGGALNITAGNATSGNGGDVVIKSGTTSGGGTNGAVRLQTNSTNRLVIDGAGALLLGSGLSAGTTGQVLTSNGAGTPPTWQAAGSSGATLGANTFTGAQKISKTASPMVATCRTDATVGRQCAALEVSGTGGFYIYPADDSGAAIGTALVEGVRSGAGTWSDVKLNGGSAVISSGPSATPVRVAFARVNAVAGCSFYTQSGFSSCTEATPGNYNLTVNGSLSSQSACTANSADSSVPVGFVTAAGGSSVSIAFYNQSWVATSPSSFQVTCMSTQ